LRSFEAGSLRIPIAAIKQGNTQFEFHLPSGLDVREGVSFPSGLAVRADVQAVGDDFLVDLLLDGEGDFTCDRCGAPFRRGVHEKVQTLFSYGSILNSGEDEDEEIRRIQPSDKELDLTQDVTDGFMLSIPAKLLCREDCRGLCPVCGADWNNVDCSCKPDNTQSTWDALKNITFD